MKVKDKVSDQIEDNPSSIRQYLGAKLGAREAYKREPPDAIQATGQHTPKYDKMSREDKQRSNAWEKRSYAQPKGNRKRPALSGGGW